MLKTKSILFILCLTVGAIGCGCHSLDTPLKGYYYEGKLPASIKADLTSTTKFASDLASETGLIIKDKSTSDVFLISNDKNSAQFNVDISFNTSKNIIYIAVRGDIENQDALTATQKTASLFAREFPDSTLTAVKVYPGLLGP
jgi:hypothetical protein